MIHHGTRYLTSSERATCQTKNPFHVLFRTDVWQERKEALVERLEFRVDKAWILPGCERGIGCCPGYVLLRTPEKEFIYLSGRADIPPPKREIVLSSGRVVTSGYCHFPFFPDLCREQAAIERWPRSKGIYRAQFSGALVDYVYLDVWHQGPLTVTGPCDVVWNGWLKDLPETYEGRDRPERSGHDRRDLLSKSTDEEGPLMSVQ